MVTLLRLLKQTLGLVKEAGIFKSDTHAVGKSLQQSDI